LQGIHRSPGETNRLRGREEAHLVHTEAGTEIHDAYFRRGGRDELGEGLCDVIDVAVVRHRVDQRPIERPTGRSRRAHSRNEAAHAAIAGAIDLRDARHLDINPGFEHEVLREELLDPLEEARPHSATRSIGWGSPASVMA
jgi:hypothetical protein